MKKFKIIISVAIILCWIVIVVLGVGQRKKPAPIAQAVVTKAEYDSLAHAYLLFVRESLADKKDEGDNLKRSNEVMMNAGNALEDAMLQIDSLRKEIIKCKISK